ncbi:MAG: hypothetical protein IJV16_01595 [Lachnospiraceae bacterium]|nr:hypothetical protein [Lachnospiraceae bacterium]
MMKMLIKLDEDKIAREKKYDINKINNYLTTAFNKRGMSRDKDGWYANGNFTTCGSMTIILSDKDWFMDNISEWLLVDTADSSMDDLKAHYSKMRLAVG